MAANKVTAVHVLGSSRQGLLGAARVGTRRLSFFCRASLNPHGQKIDLSRHRPDPITKIKRFLATTLLGGWGIGWLSRKGPWYRIAASHAPTR
jgi:hypothetical protein